MWISHRIEYWIADDLQLHHILLSQLFLFSVCWKWLLNVISLDFYQIVSLLIMCTVVKCYIIPMTLLYFFVVVELLAYWFHVPQSWHWPKRTAICLVYNINSWIFVPNWNHFTAQLTFMSVQICHPEVWRIIDFVWWKLLSWWQNSAYSVMHYTMGPGSNNKLRLVAIRSLVETLIILHSASRPQ